METLIPAAETSEPIRGGIELEPEQFFTRVGIGASRQPEKRLMLAVLEEAVRTFQHCASAHSPRGQRLFTEAEAWFASDDTDWPFSYVNICDALGLEVSALRAGLSRWLVAHRADGSLRPTVACFVFQRVSGTRHTIRVPGARRQPSQDAGREGTSPELPEETTHRARQRVPVRTPPDPDKAGEGHEIA